MSALHLEADQEAVGRFLLAMFQHADPDTFIAFRAFDDTRVGGQALFTEGVAVGAPFLLDKACIRASQAARMKRPAVFCPPVATFRSSSGAAQSDLANGVALSVECDRDPIRASATLGALLGPPTLVVASGGEWHDPETGEVQDKLHLHWRLAEPTRKPEEHALLREARELSCRIVGADATAISIVHPLRWPGSWHRKGEPRLARIVAETENEIDLGEALEQLRLVGPPETAGQADSGDRATRATLDGDRDLGADPLDITAALYVIGNTDLPWDEWNRVGMATWAASSGRAFSAFDAWSAKSTKYDPAATAARWQHYATSPPSRIGSGALFYMANQADPSWVRPSAAGLAGMFDGLGAHAEQASKASGEQVAEFVTPFVWRDPRTIPRRAWLYGKHRIRRFLSTTVAPGGVGKTSLELVEAVAMATGKPLLGVEVPEPLRVWFWCGEDPVDELERRVAGIMLHFGLTADDLGGRLFLNSGRTAPIKVVTQDRTGTKIAKPLVDELIRQLRARGVDACIIDPFISSHGVSENDNQGIEAAARAWAEIADATDSSLDLVHHVRKSKSGDEEHTVEDARGASSLIAAARAARVLNRMSEDEASKAGGSLNRFQHFRVTDGKANLAPLGERSDWFELRSVPLGNGDPDVLNDPGDWVGVVRCWQWPDLMSDVTVAQLRAAQAEVAKGRWRENFQAKDWVGIPIGQALGLDPRRDRKRILSILKVWTTNGMFVAVEGLDDRREKRTFVEVGEAASD